MIIIVGEQQADDAREQSVVAIDDFEEFLRLLQFLQRQRIAEDGLLLRHPRDGVLEPFERDRQLTGIVCVPGERLRPLAR